MAYFPFFIDLTNKKGLIIGGGTVAARKIEKLQPFNPELTVISPYIIEEIEQNNHLELIKREYKQGDEDNFFFVVAATDNRKVNKEISLLCKKKNILVNVVDDPELCTFLFPSLVKEGKLTIGITTSGASPTAAIEIKNKIRQIVPETFDNILDFLNEEREKIKNEEISEKKRKIILKELFLESMEQKRQLKEEEIKKIYSALGESLARH